MRHDISLSCQNFSLRPVAATDAAFIVSLRTDPLLSRYIHITSGGVEAQHTWLERYFERPDDYYFIVTDNRTGEPCGTVGIYDINAGRRQAEWGRWLVRHGSMAAVECAWLIYECAFAHLNLEDVYCRTVMDNHAVVSFHDSFGAQRLKVEKNAFCINDCMYDACVHSVTQAQWQTIRPRVLALAERLAQR